MHSVVVECQEREYKFAERDGGVLFVTRFLVGSNTHSNNLVVLLHIAEQVVRMDYLFVMYL